MMPAKIDPNSRKTTNNWPISRKITENDGI